MTFDIPYSFSGDPNINESALNLVVISTINSILMPYAANSDAINTTIILHADASSGGLYVVSTVGITSDALYTNITEDYDSNGISESIARDLPDAVNAVYSASGFVIDSDITSSFTVESMPSTTSLDDKVDEDLLAFLSFDYDEYRLYDWIALVGSGLLATMCCLCCLFCCFAYLERRRYNAIPDSKLNTSTGTRMTVFEMSPMSPRTVPSTTSSQIRPTAQGLEYTYTPDPDDTSMTSPRGPPLSTKVSDFRDERTSKKFDAIIGGLTSANREPLSPRAMHPTIHETENEDSELGHSFGISFGKDNPLTSADDDDQGYGDYADRINNAIISATPPMGSTATRKLTGDTQWV